jgi:hypothetical protein
MCKGWFQNAQLNNLLVYYQGRFCMQNITHKIKIFILCVVLIIANNIDQNLKVERTTKSEIKIGKI